MAYTMIKEVASAPVLNLINKSASGDKETADFQGLVKGFLNQDIEKPDVQADNQQKNPSAENSNSSEVSIAEEEALPVQVHLEAGTKVSNEEIQKGDDRLSRQTEISVAVGDVKTSIIAACQAGAAGSEQVVQDIIAGVSGINETGEALENENVPADDTTSGISSIAGDVLPVINQAAINFLFQTEKVAVTVNTEAYADSGETMADAEAKTAGTPEMPGGSRVAIRGLNVGDPVISSNNKAMNASDVASAGVAPVVSSDGKVDGNGKVQDVVTLSGSGGNMDAPEVGDATFEQGDGRDLDGQTRQMPQGDNSGQILHNPIKGIRSDGYKSQDVKNVQVSDDEVAEAEVLLGQVSRGASEQQSNPVGSMVQNTEKINPGFKKGVMDEGVRDDAVPSVLNSEARAAVSGKEGVLPGMVAHMMKRVATLQEVVDRFDKTLLSMVSGNDTSMTIHLVPPNLGKLTISCRESAGDLALNIVAENSYARSFLMNNEQTIRDVVTQNGYRLSQFDVNSGNENGGRRWFTGDREVEDRGPASKTSGKGVPASIAGITPRNAEEINENGGLWFVA